MRIAVDAMGGDHAPLEIIRGALEARKKASNLEIVLVGAPDVIGSALQTLGASEADVTVVPASEVIGFDEVPTKAIRRKKDSSIVVGLNLLKEKQVDAFVSAGSTGALLAGGLFIVGRIKGIARPALTVFVPTPSGSPMLLDIGANADVKSRHLHEFAIMGSLYCQRTRGIAAPRVALLNNGTEEGKGSELTKEAYQLLKEEPEINFVGNMEAREVALATADVIVTDGFTGNIYIKTAEGIASLLMKTIKQSLLSSLKGKLAALLMKNSLKGVKAAFDSEEVGGAPFLGINGVLIKAHGNSSAYAISNAIWQAYLAVESGYIADLAEHFAAREQEDAQDEA